MTKHITHVAFDLHQDSITAAWLVPEAQTPEVRTIPHEPKPFRHLVRQLLARATSDIGNTYPRDKGDTIQGHR